MIPMFLLILAVTSALVATFGTLPGWTQYAKGLHLIVFTREYYWPMIGLSVGLCLCVVGLVIVGKRRVWWLLGLAPVMALFMYGVANNPMRGFAVLEAQDAQFEKLSDVQGIGDDDKVLGLELDGQAYAYPYSRIYSVPVIVQSQQEKRFALIWSPFANHAVARRMALDLHARDLELVSMPANMSLVYDRKYGQFISGVSGLGLDGSKPKSLGSEIPVRKTTFKQWKTEHKDTLVLKSPYNDPGGIPTQALKPYYPVPLKREQQMDLTTSICLVPTSQPVAVLSENISSMPANIKTPDGDVVMFKDEKSDKVRAFSRTVESRVLRFVLNKNPHRENVFMVDLETHSGWSIRGVALDGLMAENNQRLTPLPTAEDCYLGVMQYWMNTLTLVEPDSVPSTICGTLFIDTNNDGARQPAEKGISELTVKLAGKDDLGQSVSETVKTNAQGFYEFKNLRPGVYSLTTSAIAGYRMGKKSVGVAGGKTASNSITEINLKSSMVAEGYDFAEIKR